MSDSTINILLVEDDPKDVRLTIHALNAAGLGTNIEVVRDGAEALDFLFCRGLHAERDIEDRPRMIMLDLKVPKVTGIEVLAEIKHHAATRPIPVVVLTSSRQEADLAACYRLGANSYIQKPFDFDDFRTTIASVARYWLVVNQPPPDRAFAAE